MESKPLKVAQSLSYCRKLILENYFKKPAIIDLKTNINKTKI